MNKLKRETRERWLYYAQMVGTYRLLSCYTPYQYVMWYLAHPTRKSTAPRDLIEHYIGGIIPGGILPLNCFINLPKPPLENFFIVFCI